MLQCASVVQSIADQAGDRMYVYLAHGMLSWSHYLLGDLTRAMEEIAKCRQVREQLGSYGLITDWFEALEAEILADAGEYDRAIAQARHALVVADQSDGIYATGLACRACAAGLAGKAGADWTRINELFEKAVDALRQGDARLQQARTYDRWADTLRRAGRTEEASVVERQAAAGRPS
jgi:tetratricopeptide (TPR) repeat protein